MVAPISIRRQDSLAAIIAAVLAVQEREVRVFVPLGQETLTNDEALHDLYEETQVGGKLVTIFTDDQHLRGRARHAGFHVGGAFDIARGPRPVADIVAISDATKPVHAAPPIPELPLEVPLPASTAYPAADEGESILDVGASLPKLKIPPLFRSRLALTVVLVCAGVAVGGGALGVILPTVEVTVVPRSEELRLTLPFKASTNPKADELAAQQVSETITLTQEYPTSGRADVTTLARGRVRIFNAYSQESQTLVEKTRLVSQDGKLFRTTQTVVVPGATVSGGNIEPSSIAVDVVAAEPGPEYNIGPSTFSIPGFQGTPKYTGFYGKSEEAISGGAEGVTVIATTEDVAKAVEGLEAKAVEEIERRFGAKAPKGLTVLDDTKLRTITVTTDVKEGEAALKVIATAEAKIQALLFSGEDVTLQAQAAIRKQLGENIVILEGSFEIVYTVSERSFEKGILSLVSEVSAKAARAIDIESLKRDIAGKKEAEIRAVLSGNKNIDFSRVTFSPFFVSRAPKNLDRIKVTVEFAQARP